MKYRNYRWFEDSRIFDERMDISLHFTERFESHVKERIKNMPHFISLAMRKGLTAADLTGRKKEYLESKEVFNYKAVIYNGYCLILSPQMDTCITIYPVPAWFSAKNHTLHKQSRRDMRELWIEENEYFYQ